MPAQISANRHSEDWLTVHPMVAEDAAAMTAMRAAVEGHKGELRGAAVRVPFDAMMEGVSAPESVTYERDTVGGISGLWCKPGDARPGQVVLHIHGGWFNWGSAQAFRDLVGHIGLVTGVAAFAPDYRRAPEDPFPAAPEDVRACYLGLIERGYSEIAVTGDSAGGNLTLGLLAYIARSASAAKDALAGAVALSPVTDLALSGASWATRAEADPYFVKPQAEELVRSYLGGHDATDPAASPLYANLTGLAPVRVHVGDDEVLLDDSVRFVERARKAGVDARLDVWEGMAHGFLGGVGRLAASSEALHAIGEFLTERFNSKQRR